MYSTILADKVKYFKEEPKGVEKMCEKMENLLDEVRAEEAKNTVTRLWKNGIKDINLIASSVNLSVDEVNKIISNI